MSSKSKNVQIKPSSKKGDEKVNINLSEELTIYNIEDVKDSIINTVQKYNHIEIQGSEIKEMDLSFVQLINSIQKTTQKLGKELSMNIELNEESQELFNNTDITKIIKNK